MSFVARHRMLCFEWFPTKGRGAASELKRRIVRESKFFSQTADKLCWKLVITGRPNVLSSGENGHTVSYHAKERKKFIRELRLGEPDHRS